MRDEISKLPGLKERELVQLGDCAVCGRKLLEGDGIPLFFVVEISRAGVDLNAVQRRAGLGMMMGSDPLARVFSPDEDLAAALVRANLGIAEVEGAVA